VWLVVRWCGLRGYWVTAISLNFDGYIHDETFWVTNYCSETEDQNTEKEIEEGKEEKNLFLLFLLSFSHHQQSNINKLRETSIEACEEHIENIFSKFSAPNFN
jgi:hypothetical protein